MFCYNCDKPCANGETMLNLYGETLCEDCWDEYICTDRGRIEYFVDIVSGKYSKDCFDADFLGEVYTSWQNHKEELFTEEEIESLERIAKGMGIC